MCQSDFLLKKGNLHHKGNESVKQQIILFQQWELQNNTITGLGGPCGTRKPNPAPTMTTYFRRHTHSREQDDTPRSSLLPTRRFHRLTHTLARPGTDRKLVTPRPSLDKQGQGVETRHNLFRAKRIQQERLPVLVFGSRSLPTAAPRSVRHVLLALRVLLVEGWEERERISVI
jgi:hypothetical protein